MSEDEHDSGAADAPLDTAPERQRFEVGREHRGLSLFDFLDAVAGPLDRKLLLGAAHARRILLNGDPVTASATLRVGDFVELSQPADEFARPARSDLAILHADERCVVADKPSGMAFSESRHGGRSALDLLAGRYPSPRAIHRLDKETSGVVVVALGRQAEEQLGAELRAGEAHVEYVAVVRGTLQEDHGRIDVPLGKRRKSDVRLVPDPDHGDPCATAWTLQEELRGFAVLRLIPEHGGRSHQVRAHLAAAGLPALCDQLYGEDDRLLLSQLKLDYRPKRGRPERAIVTRPVLHAERYVSPALNVVAPLPGELEVLLAQLRRLRPPG